MTTYGLLVFDGVEALDLVGPWQVFASSASVRDREGAGTDTVVTVAERPGHVHAGKQPLQILPNTTFEEHPPLDVVVVPGGAGTRHEETNPATLDWIRRVAERADWVTSVCTGARLLHAAGPARGRRVATDWEFEDELEARGDVTVVRDARYVVDGNLVTSQGVSAGIDMALWLVGRLHGRDHSRFVRRKIQYEPAPPYMADEPLAH
jgi:transcriptional regulator GlxA family with amidase domain